MPEPLHVLIVEDSPKDAEALLHALRKAGFLPEWKRVDTEADYIQSLNPGLDLILSDQKMPQFNGLRALELLKRTGLEVPFILISGEVGEESAVGAMKMGATDYLLRDRLARLGPAVANALEQSQARRQRKKVEAELKESEERCLRAQRMESIGALANGIAHDLNNILSPIMMAVEMLKEASKDDHSKNILATIEANARRGSEIVRQVLSFGRGLDGHRIEVQPKHLLKDIETIIKDTFPKNIRLQVTARNDCWAIPGYPTQLHQILLNLCLNARDSMPGGGVLNITIENEILDQQYANLDPQATPGPYAVIEVSDSGEGFSEDELERIFDPFFTRRSNEQNGAGQGLPAVMALVKAHQGFLNVESEPGKGTRFRVCLPATPENQEALVIQTALPRGNGETVLLIDDESSVLSITSQTLEEFGYRVMLARNGAEAIALYAKHQEEISAVLTDLMMPVMDGSATVHALQRINPGVKIIVTSGLDPKAEDGIRHFLPKPYTARALLEKLRELIGGTESLEGTTAT